MTRRYLCLIPLLLSPITLSGQESDVVLPEGWSEDPPALDSLVSFDRGASDLRSAVRRYLADERAIERRYPVEYSPKRIARLREFYRGWQLRLAALDFDAINHEGQIDHVALSNRITYSLEMLRLEALRATEIATLVPFAGAIRELQEQRYDRVRVEPRVAAATIHELAEEVAELTREVREKGADREKVEVTKGSDSESAGEVSAGEEGDGESKAEVSAVVAFRAARHTEHLAEVLESFNTFYDGYDPLYSWWVREPYGRLKEGLAEYVAVLDEVLVGIVEGEKPPVVGDPVLAAGLQAYLDVAMIPYSPEELIEIGEAEFEWIVNEFRAVAASMGYEDDWKAALEHTKQLAPPPGEKPWAIFEIAEYSEAFLKELDAITVPDLAAEVWRLAMQTPEAQLVNPFFTGGETTRVSYPTDGMTHEDKLMSMRGNTPHFNFATVHHELIPGHHLQGFMGSRFNNHRSRMGWNPFWGEGWALYWELRLWEHGFPRNDPDRIGMLFWRLHRAARIVFSLNFQLGRWTPQEAIDFLIEEVGHEPANAEAEVRRTAQAHPLYQIAYMIGGLQFRSLHRELVESGRMSERDFHDAVLQGGSMPVELVRARLTGQELTRDFESSWRFYELEGDD